MRESFQDFILRVERSTSALYGADWGASDQTLESDKDAQKQMEEDFDAFTESKSVDLTKSLSSIS